LWTVAVVPVLSLGRAGGRNFATAGLFRPRAGVLQLEGKGFGRPRETGMGIYDREYYRREGPSVLASFTDAGRACWTLILINIAVFVLQVLTLRWGEAPLGDFTDFFVLDPERVLNDGQVWRLLTYAFLHQPTTLWHIVFNMLFLWWLGTDVEDLYGSAEFVAIYLVSCVLG